MCLIERLNNFFSRKHSSTVYYTCRKSFPSSFETANYYFSAFLRKPTMTLHNKAKCNLDEFDLTCDCVVRNERYCDKRIEVIPQLSSKRVYFTRQRGSTGSGRSQLDFVIRVPVSRNDFNLYELWRNHSLE